MSMYINVLYTQGECKRLQDEENRLKDKAKQLLAVARRETGVSDPDMLSLDLKKVHPL